jgi:site-specific DNA-methyltransferase (adenine-specific)
MMDLRLGDCLEILPTLTGFDVVIMDPPYGIDGSKGHINKARGKGDYSGYFSDTPDYISSVVVPMVNTLRKMCRSVIVTPGNRNFSLYPQPDSFGCFYQPTAVGLQTFGNLDAQPIFYYGKNASGRNMGVPCSYQLTEMPEKNGHPCVKPIKIWTRLIVNNSLPGQTIFDPFMGSGTTGVACVQTGRNFIGIEINPKYYEIAQRRIEDAQRQPLLFVCNPEPKPEQLSMWSANG